MKRVFLIEYSEFRVRENIFKFPAATVLVNKYALKFIRIR